MYSVLQEIEKLREGLSVRLNETLSNRYTLHCQESRAIKTAYCFSVPIRNIKTNDIVNLRFYHNKQGSIFIGSGTKISVSDRIRILNQFGQCDIVFQGVLSKKTDKAIFFSNNTTTFEIRPTLNGVILLFDCISNSDPPKILLHLNRAFEATRSNNHFFSVMRERFIPFITVSCIGTLNACGKVSACCEVYNEKINDFEYLLTFCTADKCPNRIAVEINMQEPKLFQDTTVESKHPTMNNVFGGVSFLGTSKDFGEQWLYSRLEISNIAQIQSKKIIKSILHVPQLGYNTTPITVHRISERFCSFGSNWENKIAVKDTVATSSESNGYYHLDLTKLLGNFRKKSENFVIRGNATNKPVIISTGDSFYSPQILEVKYQ